MALVNAQCTGAQQNLLTASGKTLAITNILVCNTDTGTTAGQFDLHFRAGGAPLATTNQVINNLELPAKETFTFDSERIILNPGDVVSIVGDTVLAVTISYLEV